MACSSESNEPRTESDAGGDASNDAGTDSGWPADAPPPDGALDGTADGALDADAAADGPKGPPPGNALWLGKDGALPLVPVTAPSAATRAVAFQASAGSVRVLDEDGNEMAKHALGEGTLFGGFDFDADGYPDLGMARSKDSGQTCGGSAMLDTSVDLISTLTGQTFPAAPWTPAKCWTFGTTTYPTTQWSSLGVLFGAGGNELAVVPYYAEKGSFIHYSSGALQSLGEFQYPSTALFDSTYQADQPNAWGGPQSFLANSHVANGLVVTVGGSRRLAFFTSGRAVSYAMTQLGATQLVLDTPFVTGDRKDLAGRNYGLVLIDPGKPSELVLLSGTGAQTVHDDMVSSSMSADPWGQIERHVTRYDLVTGKVIDRFFSYAHDNNDGMKYEGRLAYPANPIVRAPSGASGLAFNVYQGGHWMLHVTGPGALADVWVKKDLFLWDIVDLDRDGVDEWVVTPSRDPSEPDVPGYYYVKWRTELAHFDASLLTLTTTKSFPGVIPHLSATFREPTRTSSMAYLYPVLYARTDAGMALLTRDASGTVSPQPY